LVIVVFLGAASLSAVCRGREESLPTPPQSNVPATQSATPQTQPSAAMSQVRPMPQASFHSDGVFDESYFRQMQHPMHSYAEIGGIPQANGWTSYGFPSRSYRWGWFGAQSHYPRVSWRESYYGDKSRVAYWPWY
jgi:hypothetical protein